MPHTAPAAPVVVIGAGISGVACARELAAVGVPVRLLDRGRRIGGRMGSKRLAGRATDLGASYFTVSDPDFAEVVADWERRGLARPWTDTFTVLSAGEQPSRKSGPMRWSAPGALRSLVEDLADARAPLVAVEHAAVSSVDRDAEGRLLVDGQVAGAVVLAMPDGQARTLLGPAANEEVGPLERSSEPVIALVAWWPERTWDDRDPHGRFEGAFVNGDQAIGWIADDGRRRGDDAPVLVAHSTAALAAEHLDEPQAAGPPMLEALRRLMDLEAPLGTHVHRWSLARPIGEREAPYLLTDRGIGLCGDGWGSSPKVETAWRSGRDLGRALGQQLGHP